MYTHGSFGYKTHATTYTWQHTMVHMCLAHSRSDDSLIVTGNDETAGPDTNTQATVTHVYNTFTAIPVSIILIPVLCKEGKYRKPETVKPLQFDTTTYTVYPEILAIIKFGNLHKIRL